MRELKYVISQQNPKKAPGYDRIDIRLIKNLLKTSPDLLLLLYNKCFQLGHFPNAWKKGIVIFFRKKNKNPKVPTSYRPITLLPMMGKILERLIKIRTMTYLEHNKFFLEEQHGFREQRSTITAIKVLKNMHSRITTKSYIYRYNFIRHPRSIRLHKLAHDLQNNRKFTPSEIP